jgi:hypothetical protein
MLTFKAEAFLMVTSDLATLRSSISTAIVSAEVHGAPADKDEREDFLRQIVLNHLTDLSKHLDTLGAKITKIAVNEMIPYLSGVPFIQLKDCELVWMT